MDLPSLTMSSRPLALLLASFGLVVACGGGAAPPPVASAVASPTETPAARLADVAITASEFAFQAPDHIEGGLVRVTLMDAGALPHNADFGLLKAGATPESFRAALAKGPAAALPLIDPYGGPGFTPPGATSRVILDLAAGEYALLSSTAYAADKAPDFAKGMVAFIAVTAPLGPPTAEPTAAATATLGNGQPLALTEVKAGSQVWRVVVEGQAPRNLVVLRLGPAKTADDFATWLKVRVGPAPGDIVGGMHNLASGHRGWALLDLVPGDYAASEFSAPGDGRPLTFTIR